MYESTYNAKQSFLQRHQLTKQKNDFETILSSFPDSILIAKPAPIPVPAPRPEPVEHESDLENSRAVIVAPEGTRVVLPEIRFVNKVMTRKFLNANENGINEGLAEKKLTEY